MTAPPKETVTYDVHDAAVRKMLTDASGGTATYGPWVDVPGIQSVSLDPEFASAILKGDARTIARKGKVDSFTASFQYGVLSLDVLDVLIEATMTSSGTGAAETHKFRVKGDNQLPYFEAAFAIEDVSVGLAAVHVSLYKAQVTGGSLFGQSTDEFGNRSFAVSGIARLSDDVMLDIDFFETATTIAASQAT
jgi:hypothetical protein